MTHISKNQLKQADLDKLFNQFETTLTLLRKDSSQGFVAELLGREEKIMLSKRLAAIVMFIEGNSSYRVWQLLKMSPSTADRIKLNYENGNYQSIEKTLKKNKVEYIEFWKSLEIILQAGMPSRGRGRWKSVFSK